MFHISLFFATKSQLVSPDPIETLAERLVDLFSFSFGSMLLEAFFP